MTVKVAIDKVSYFVLRKACCSTLAVFVLSRGCKCYVSLPRGAMAWSAFIACDIS